MMKQHSTAQTPRRDTNDGNTMLRPILFMKHPSPQANTINTGCRSLHDNRDQLLLLNAKFEVLIAAADSGL